MATRIRSTKKYKALIAAGFDENQALKALGHEPAPAVDNRVAQLVAAGFTTEQAQAALGLQAAAPVAPAAPAPLTAKERAEALVAQAGLTFTKGRVYVTPSIVEAIVRVTKTGTPEVVTSSGVGRTAAVLIQRESSGDVSVQNLARPV